MSAQLTYGFSTPIGDAGGIVDLAPYAINSFINEAATGALHFGMGVVVGTKPGVGVTLPSAVTGVFEGIVTNRRTTERDLEGGLALRNKATVGVMRYGNIYVLLEDDEEPEYGDPVYLICTGEDAGKFTATSDTNTLLINARFIGGANNGIAPVELFNGGAAGGGSEYELPTASASTLGGVKVGTGLAIDDNGVLSVSAG